MLSDLFTGKDKIFKLVCGAGNECEKDVERLTSLYSDAGAQLFDICAKPEILLAAKRGIEKSGKNNRYICVSVGMKGDPHISKAVVNDSSCIKCSLCNDVCINNAVSCGVIDKVRCIGCGACAKACPQSAISMYETDVDLSACLPELIKTGIDCIELHATSELDADIWDKWGVINSCYDGMLSVCIDRLNLGNKQVLDRLRKMLKKRKPYSTIIQADGIPMSGSDDNYKTTLQAVAMAEIIQNADLNCYLLISGGTNSKTAELAKMCNIKYNGIAIGSYARKIVSEYIKRDDFYTADVYDKALEIAKNLVGSVN
ncbi:MAG: 4Fe-4S binding protein [Cyanobacteria bacterium RUI128]|nr:4Fe-4S binding protein [Cyanobacteria bacterium RUI128]